MTYESGIITTVAGTGERGYAGDGGAAGAALMSEPFMCAFRGVHARDARPAQSLAVADAGALVDDSWRLTLLPCS